MKSTKRKSSAALSILLLLVSSVFGLVMVEIVLSVVRPAPIFEKINITSIGAEYSLSSNPKLIYVPKGGVGEHNSYGHRGKEYTVEKNEKKRVLFMGDSVVEGLGVRVEDRITERLNDKLGNGFEVINLAVRGYNFLQEVEYFKEVGVEFSPDVVFWGITYNDFRLHSGEVFEIDKIMKGLQNNAFFNQYYSLKNELEKTLFQFNIYRYGKYFLSRHSDEKFSKSVRYIIEDSQIGTLIEQIRALSREKGFKLHFVFLPVNTDREAERLASMEKMLKASGTEVLNIEKVLNSSLVFEEKKALFVKNDPCHLTPDGNKVVADIVEKYFRDQVFPNL